MLSETQFIHQRCVGMIRTASMNAETWEYTLLNELHSTMRGRIRLDREELSEKSFSLRNRARIDGPDQLFQVLEAKVANLEGDVSFASSSRVRKFHLRRSSSLDFWVEEAGRICGYGGELTSR